MALAWQRHQHRSISISSGIAGDQRNSGSISAAKAAKAISLSVLGVKICRQKRNGNGVA
jgi:hypothetical protein